MRNQLQQAYDLLNARNLQPSLKCGLYDTDLVTLNIDLQSFHIDNRYEPYTWVDYNGNLYKARECVILVGTNEEFPNFGLVDFVLSDGKGVKFLYRDFNVIGFDAHRHSYLVNVNNISNEISLISSEDLPDRTPLILRNVSDEYYVTPPYSY